MNKAGYIIIFLLSLLLKSNCIYFAWNYIICDIITSTQPLLYWKSYILVFLIVLYKTKFKINGRKS